MIYNFICDVITVRSIYKIYCGTKFLFIREHSLSSMMFFNLTYVEIRGIAFGLFQGRLNIIYFDGGC